MGSAVKGLMHYLSVDYCLTFHCLNGYVLLGIFHPEWEDDWKAGSPNTEGRVLPDRRNVEQ